MLLSEPPATHLRTTVKTNLIWTAPSRCRLNLSSAQGILFHETYQSSRLLQEHTPGNAGAMGRRDVHPSHLP